jgi:hypothetical protein
MQHFMNLRSAGKLLTVVGFLLPLFSCGKSPEEKLMEKAIEQSTGKKVDIDADGNKLTIESDGQKMEFQQQQKGVWPADIPSDVPEFSRGKIVAVTRASIPENESWSVVYEDVKTTDLKDYEPRLKERGFTTSATFFSSDEGEHGTVSGQKGKLNVAVMAGSGKASLSVVSEK